MTPLKLQWLWFKQWPLWLVAPNSIEFYAARVEYARAVAEWLNPKA